LDVDAVYSVANTNLCSLTCSCNADKKLWSDSTFSKLLMSTSSTGALNFPQCPGATTAVDAVKFFDKDYLFLFNELFILFIEFLRFEEVLALSGVEN